MPGQQHSYRSIFKATSLFGGVQFVNILISVIRSKVIALFIGPSGMGIFGLLMTTLNLVSSVTNLGLDKSAVKELSVVNKSQQIEKSARLMKIIRKLVWYSGIAGAFLMIIFSQLLSKIAFGNQDYTLGFIWLSIALLFNQLSAGELAILQGLRRLKYLAKANLLGNLFALTISIPLYYFFRLEAIVPTIVISSLIALLFTLYFGRKAGNSTERISIFETLREGKEMIRLGVVLSMGGIIAVLANYLVQIFISRYGSVAEVGFFTAGNMVLNAYVGLIFNAMATDYFPRLSAIADQMNQVRQTVLEQANIALLLLLPILVILIFLSPWVIQILYASEFKPVVPFLVWGLAGMLFKATSWSVGYVIIAKGDSQLYIRTATFFSILMVSIYAFGYFLNGLEGLGIGMCIYFCIHFIGLTLITFKRYGFFFHRELYLILAICVFLTSFAVWLTYLENSLMVNGIKILVVIISSLFAVYFLNKKMGIFDYLKQFFNRNKH